MIPIGDDRRPGGPPALVTWALIVLNVLVFLVELSQPSPSALQSFIQAWGIVPREYSVGRDLAPHIPLPFWITIFTSMFLHGGFLHLGGNMLYLWVFGENVERRLGHGRFLLFFLLCGLAAGLGHIGSSLSSSVPTIGASGAISGILGGYLMLFPRHRVRVLTYFGVVAVPAVLMLGLWILIQVVSEMSPENTGVAYVAHIVGFVAGLVLVRRFAGRRRRRRAYP